LTKHLQRPAPVTHRAEPITAKVAFGQVLFGRMIGALFKNQMFGAITQAIQGAIGYHSFITSTRYFE